MLSVQLCRCALPCAVVMMLASCGAETDVSSPVRTTPPYQDTPAFKTTSSGLKYRLAGESP